jgi:hypothetical protein
MKNIGIATALAIVALGIYQPTLGWSQVNTGSDGSDGVFNPTVSTNINMADHPTGMYQYISVKIPSGVTVTFTPNAKNTPVYWLVQGSVAISGNVDVSGHNGNGTQGGAGGPGGYSGGNGANGSTAIATSGQGLGGGIAGGNRDANYDYANSFLIPLLGGSGGAGGDYWGVGSGQNGGGGGGGGGALLIAANQNINVTGSVLAGGGDRYYGAGGITPGGYGSGGGIRLVASKVSGNGIVTTGNGRVRFDTFDDEFSGPIGGAFSKGSQFIILPASGQLPQLTVTSIGGIPVSQSPTGVLSTPDAVLSAQQTAPVPVIVSCLNLPLNSLITVTVKPANGSSVSATGYNSTGSLASSSATLSINIPRGGGLVYATVVTSK